MTTLSAPIRRKEDRAESREDPEFVELGRSETELVR